MNRRGLALVTHDCEPTLRYDWFSGSVEWKWRRMASRSGFLSWQMVVFCVGCCYCRTVCLCLSRCLQNPFAMMPCGIQGHPISNRNEVCLGFFCLCCTANSVGVICFISSFVFVGIFFFFLTSSFGNPTVYLSIIRAVSDCDASFFLDPTAAASQYMMQSNNIPPLADVNQSLWSLLIYPKSKPVSVPCCNNTAILL